MSREWMFKTLVSLGFNEKDAQVYVFLAEEGPHKVRELTEVLGLGSQQLYNILRKLQKKGIVNASSDIPACFSAVLFEKVLDLSIEARIDQQKALQASKEKLISTWRSLTEKKGNNS